MKKLTCLFASFLFAWTTASAFGDTIVLITDREVHGTVIQTNAEDVLLLTDFTTLRFSRQNIKRIRIERTDTQAVSKERIADSKTVIASLSKQKWATNLKQIPATVVDNGILRNVPYISFRCGNDYEVNIYGDLEHPAGIEAGIYRALLQDNGAKANCRSFVESLLGQTADKDVLHDLRSDKDKRSNDSLTFEITPPTDEDAYNGWWISVYDEAKLKTARASDEELDQISLPKGAAARLAEDDEAGNWTTGEVQLARPSTPNRVTFTNRSGMVVSNAQVVRVIDGVSLIWRDGASGGVVKLADLPPDLQQLYGYDAAKTAAADAADKDKKARERQAQFQAFQAQTQVAAAQTAVDSSPSYSGYTGGSSYGSGDRVYVRSYYRKDGTYVHAHTRSYPHRH